MKARIEPLTIAVVGATGLVGGMIPQILDERQFPVKELQLFASTRTAGTIIRFKGQDIRVEEVSEKGFTGVDIAFFAAGGAVSKQFIPIVVQNGGIAIDKSSHFRMDPTVPLVVPEVNGEALLHHNGIISNPNCVATPLALVLAPLKEKYGLAGITLATYQAASGAGKQLVAELAQQEKDDASGTIPQSQIYPHVLHRNVVPGGWSMEGDETEEEVKVRDEIRKILNLTSLPISVTTVRVPVMVGHAGALWVDLCEQFELNDIRELFNTSQGIGVVDDADHQQYPMPRLVMGQDLVYVGRLRKDQFFPNRLAIFWSADNLRKGAATNAIQIAELLIDRKYSRLAHV